MGLREEGSNTKQQSQCLEIVGGSGDMNERREIDIVEGRGRKEATRHIAVYEWN